MKILPNNHHSKSLIFYLPLLIIFITPAFSQLSLSKSIHSLLHLQQLSFFSERQGKHSNQKLTQNNESLSFLLEEQYIGNYENLQKQQPILDYINSESGTIQAILYKNQYSPSIYEIDSFQMILFDPIYHDQRALKVSVSLGKMTNKNEWNQTNSIIQISKFWKQRTDGGYNISNITYSIKLQGLDNKNPKQVIMYIEFLGNNLNINAQLHYNDSRLSTLGYCLYVTSIVIIQIISAMLLNKKIQTTNPNIINKLSLTTIALCNIEDFYLTMIHIQYIMTSMSNTYLFYILPSLGYIILFVGYDMKLLFLVWRSHYMREIDNPQALRKKLTTFYIKFYVGLFVYLTLTYFFSFDVWLIILQNLILIPQIIYNARIGNNPGFQPYYVLGYIGARVLIPFYQRVCPNNHFMLTPIVGLVVVLFILYTLQIIILFLQAKIGPRFFIPKIMQPDYYNYNFKIKANQETKDMECSICLQNFFNEHHTNQQINAINASQLEQPIIIKEKTIMKTPCNHFFHRDCLTSWIDVKLECPSCRTLLPPL